MIEHALLARRNFRVWFWRAQQSVGWAGLGGLAMMIAAVVIFGLTWPTRPEASTASSPAETPAKAPMTPALWDASAMVVALAPPALVDIDDVLRLLAQMEQIAVLNGLGWVAAEYRITPASDTQSSSLEVRSTFKGPYPKLRSMLSQILREVPATTLRELNLSRSSSDLADIEAKVVIAVLLQEEPVLAVSKPANFHAEAAP